MNHILLFCMSTVFNFIIDIVTLYYLQYDMDCVIFLWITLFFIINKHLTWQKANLKLCLPCIISDSYCCSVHLNVAELCICIALHPCVAQELDTFGMHLCEDLDHTFCSYFHFGTSLINFLWLY